MMENCRITIEWTENGEPKKRSTNLNLPNNEKEVILIHIRAAFKAIYKSLLSHLGYSNAEIIGTLSTQMLDRPRDEQRKAVKYTKEIFDKEKGR